MAHLIVVDRDAKKDVMSVIKSVRKDVKIENKSAMSGRQRKKLGKSNTQDKDHPGQDDVSIGKHSKVPLLPNYHKHLKHHKHYQPKQHLNVLQDYKLDGKETAKVV